MATARDAKAATAPEMVQDARAATVRVAREEKAAMAMARAVREEKAVTEMVRVARDVTAETARAAMAQEEMVQEDPETREKILIPWELE